MCKIEIEDSSFFFHRNEAYTSENKGNKIYVRFMLKYLCNLLNCVMHLFVISFT